MKKISITLLFLIFGLFFHQKTYAIPIDIKGLDFKSDVRKSKEWAKDTFNQWEKELTSQQKEAIKRLNSEKELEHLNKFLRDFGSDLTDSVGFFIYKDKKEEYLRDDRELNKIINSKQAKLRQNTYVYTNSTFSDVNISIHNEIIKQGRIDLNIFREFRELASGGIINNYKIVSLTDSVGKPEEVIKWRILLPQGTPVGSLGNGELFLDKDAALSISKIWIINQKGKDFIRIDANLVNKNTIDSEISTITNKVNTDINQLVGFPKDTAFLDLRLKNELASITYNQIDKLIADLTSTVDPTIIKEVFTFMKSYDGKLIITDSSPAYLKESFYNNDISLEDFKMTQDSIGFYLINSKNLVMSVPKTFETTLKINQDGTFIHEFGHALDNYLGKSTLGMDEISNSEEFKKIFLEEGQNISPYAGSNPQEFFAITFMLIHSENEDYIKKVKEIVPKTCEFIDKCEQSIILK